MILIICYFEASMVSPRSNHLLRTVTPKLLIKACGYLRSVDEIWFTTQEAFGVKHVKLMRAQNATACGSTFDCGSVARSKRYFSGSHSDDQRAKSSRTE
ncbi:hypothetical protein GGR53DRAFT_46013 [Hypoxylon sp. FL1150]|nr:hypothetical protein GGR53DRAFT_46013 [Hypoxylon sp. FL1150]